LKRLSLAWLKWNITSGPTRDGKDIFQFFTAFLEAPGKSPVLFPLTPALSLGERENSLPMMGRADILGRSSVLFCQRPEV